MGKLKSAEELGIKEFQRVNLARLTIFVREFVDDEFFNMSIFNGWNDYALDASYECGTQSCFCGYGPLAGIKANSHESWDDYRSRCFGSDGYGGDALWFLLFSSDHIDSKVAAARRGAYFLMKGLPRFHGMRGDMCNWEAPESFWPNWEAIQELAEKDGKWTLKEAVAKAKKVSNFAK